MTTLPFTGGQAQVPTIWLYAGFALMLIALGVMMPMLRMRMAAAGSKGTYTPERRPLEGIPEVSMAVADIARRVGVHRVSPSDDRRARDKRGPACSSAVPAYTPPPLSSAWHCGHDTHWHAPNPADSSEIGPTDAQARSVSQAASLFPEGSRQSAIRSAVEYNQRLYESGQPQIGEPVFDGKTKGDFEGDDEYRRQLSVNGLDAMGELLVPKISVDMPIMHGAGQDVLEHAAGHLAGTSLPVGGKNTRAVITGHSNLKGATLFTRFGRTRRRATRSTSRSWATRSPTGSTDIRIVSSHGHEGAARSGRGRDEVTLLTCTGQGNTLRLLVTGERNSMPDQAPLPGASPGDTKQAALVSGVTVTGVLAIGFSLCRSRRVSGRHMSC